MTLPAVAATLERDLERHGPPLVLRLDRAACHQTERVRAVLRSYGVLELQGPPHHPGFYGQLERQNREHFTHVGELDPSGLQRETERLRGALNGVWKRPTLDWRTATDVWNERPRLVEDRHELRKEVENRAARIRRQDASRDVPEDLAMRLAIEKALTNRGYLRREDGGWC